MATVKISIPESDLELYREEAQKKGISLSKCLSQHLNSNACSKKINTSPKKRMELLLPEELSDELRSGAKTEGKTISRYVEDILTAKGKPKTFVVSNELENGLAEQVAKHVENLESLALMARQDGLYDADIQSAVLEARQMKKDLFTVIGELVRAKTEYKNRLQKTSTYKKS